MSAGQQIFNRAYGAPSQSIPQAQYANGGQVHNYNQQTLAQGTVHSYGQGYNHQRNQSFYQAPQGMGQAQYAPQQNYAPPLAYAPQAYPPPQAPPPQARPPTKPQQTYPPRPSQSSAAAPSKPSKPWIPQKYWDIFGRSAAHGLGYGMGSATSHRIVNGVFNRIGW
eukprot:g903.t1